MAAGISKPDLSSDDELEAETHRQWQGSFRRSLRSIAELHAKDSGKRACDVNAIDPFVGHLAPAAVLAIDHRRVLYPKK